jgi:hypothetical protein
MYRIDSVKFSTRELDVGLEEWVWRAEFGVDIGIETKKAVDGLFSRVSSKTLRMLASIDATAGPELAFELACSWHASF